MNHQNPPQDAHLSLNLLSRVDFGNEAGDDIDPEEIKNFFVAQETFAWFLDPKYRMMLATAKKGVGKSALIRWIEYMLATDPSENALIIRCKGNDLVRANFNMSAPLRSPNEYIRDWMVRLCTLVNRKLAQGISVAIGDDYMSLVENAEIDGYRKKNLISALTDRLKTKSAKLPEHTRPKVANEIELLKRIAGKRVWILIDDLDATYQRSNDENLELSTFFSACRYLTTEIKGLFFRVTMRTDVWPIIRRYDESLDKMEQYVSDITWSQKDFRSLLYRRIKYQLDLLKVPVAEPPLHVTEDEIQEHYIDLIFAKRMIWGDFERRTYKIIYTMSYHRPRWAIQLCKLAQAEALHAGATTIQRDHIDEIWGQYGKRRIEDLIVEHKHQCGQVEELLNGFRGAERRMDRKDLLKWIENHITNHITPVIDGAETKAPMQIGHFLFRIGFIVARVQDGNEDYEHYYFSDMPDFLSGRTNQDFNSVWEIHPCYREALDIAKLNRYQKKNRNLAR